MADVPRDPEELTATAAAAPPTAVIAPGTHMGTVTLTVADLDRSIAYYRDAIGLSPLRRTDGVVALGTDPERELLILEEVPGAVPADGFPGLYHVAFLLPDRHHLARYVAHLARERVPIAGMADHDVSEAIYLQDPDHHGIEVYCDRPRARWEGQVATRMGTAALDVDALLGELADPATEPFTGQPAGTTMGHVHLRVADVEATIGFYRDVLGFELMAQLGRQAAFLAAGGYHHHLGANTWETRRRGTPPEGTARLREVTIVLPDAAEHDRTVARLNAAGTIGAETPDGTVLVHDPSGIALRLAVAEPAAAAAR
jgi:catechol 2,3-dioxygenase